MNKIASTFAVSPDFFRIASFHNSLFENEPRNLLINEIELKSNKSTMDGNKEGRDKERESA